MTKSEDGVFLFLKETEGDAKRASRALLKEALEAFFRETGAKEEKVFRLPSGKIVFPSGEKHLSVTHTGSLYACAFAPFPVGLDGEKKDEVRKNVAEKFFSPEERLFPFARIWCAKEAVSKLDGRGLSILQKILVSGNEAAFEGKKYLLTWEEAGEYLLCLAREKRT